MNRRTLSIAIAVLALTAVCAPAFAGATAIARKGKIAFIAQANDRLQLFTVNPDGRRLRQVTHYQLMTDAGLAWSPGGRRLLFVLFEGGGGDKIFKSSADGSGLKLVSPRCTGSCSDNYPVYSPDGTRIAFERAWAFIGGGSASAIFTMNPDGRDLTQLTQTIDAPTTSEDSRPAWSPDGRKIAFVRTYTTATPNESAIEVMNADGSNVRDLTGSYLDAGDPHWSPNGKRILFNTYALPTPGKSANLYTIRPEGTHLVALTHYTGGTLQAFADDWSPDGTQILFNRVASSGTDTSVGGFYILNLRTKHVRRLTRVPVTGGDRAAWGR